MLVPLQGKIAAADARLAALVATDPVVQRLTTAPGVGSVTACAAVATLNDITRFASAEQVAAYLGLVPAEYSSSERQQCQRSLHIPPQRNTSNPATPARRHKVEALGQTRKSQGSAAARAGSGAAAVGGGGVRGSSR